MRNADIEPLRDDGVEWHLRAKMPAAYILVPFALGIWASEFLGVGLAASVWAGIAISALALAVRSHDRLSHLCLYAAVFFLGSATLVGAGTPGAGHISGLLDGARAGVEVRGYIADDPASGPARYGGIRTSFPVRVESVRSGGRWARSSGLVEASVYSESRPALGFGDRLELYGVLSRPSGLKNPGLFDYSRYLANRGIYALLNVKDLRHVRTVPGGRPNPVRALAYRIRGFMRSALDGHLDEPDRSLAKAMLIGDRSGLGQGLNDDFVRTGTVHILSISGLHVGLIAALAFWIFGLLRIPRKANFALTVAFLSVYIYVAGAAPPITRAVIMFAIVAAGYIFEREASPLNSLAIAAVLILLANPRQLFDTSFQLSFGSLASVFIFTPRIERIVGAGRFGRGNAGRRLATYVLKGASVSIAAWIGTWPVIAASFNIISPVSVIANLVVIPMSFVSMVSAIALIAVSPFPAAANLAAVLVGLVDKALFSVNHIFASAPLAYFRLGSPSAVAVLLYYALLAIWIAPPPYPRDTRPRLAMGFAAILVLAGLNAAVWVGLARDVRAPLKISFLDVGSGDAAFLRFPDGRNLLIDAGPGGGEGLFDAARMVVAPYLWNEGVGSIDAILVTHPHSDHIGGVRYMLENFKVGAVYDNGAPYEGEIFKRYLSAIRGRGLRRVAVHEGDELNMSGSSLRILSPEGSPGTGGENVDSIAAQLVYGNRHVLFASDVESGAIERILDGYGASVRSDILKAPHHGGDVGDELLMDRFYRTVSPTVTIISAGRVGAGVRRQERAISGAGSMCYDTAANGAIIVSIGASGYEVRPYIK